MPVDAYSGATYLDAQSGWFLDQHTKIIVVLRTL
jgi:hypothetical protein